jgi:molybdopterin-containing oxidoreductase family membrane subunit
MTFQNRMHGPYAWSYYTLLTCNGLIPQLIWFKKVRTSIPWLFVISLIVSVGMWFERFVIIVTSLSFEYVPGKWGMYYPTFWDYATYAGTFGLFLTMFLLFVRFVPSISIAEVRELVHHHGHHAGIADHLAERGEINP